MVRSSILCNAFEANKLVNELQVEANASCEELNQLCNSEQPVSIKVAASQFGSGWGVTAILYWGEALIKTYPIAELALLDVQAFILKCIQHAYCKLIGESDE